MPITADVVKLAQLFNTKNISDANEIRFEDRDTLVLVVNGVSVKYERRIGRSWHIVWNVTIVCADCECVWLSNCPIDKETVDYEAFWGKAQCEVMDRDSEKSRSGLEFAKGFLKTWGID